MPEDTVIFVHVPKTAGTTLHWIIDRQYRRRTVLLQKRRFGWRNVFSRRHNANPTRPELASIPAEVLAVLREHNQFDLDLYAFAEELFERQVEAQGPEFARAVRRFRAVNRYAWPGLWVWEKARQVSVHVWLRTVWKRLGL
jgi:hypothetical protein